MAAWIKVVFGCALAGLYVLVAWTMIDGALNEVGYAPNDATDWLVTIASGGLIAFVAAQIGVVVATEGNGIKGRMQNRLFGSGTQLTASDERAASAAVLVLVVDVAVLLIVGGFFIWLYVRPANIAVAEGAKPLKDAPAYISLQAQAIVGLIVAGAGAVGVAAAK